MTMLSSEDGCYQPDDANSPPVSRLGLRILRSELENASSNVVELTLQYRDLSHIVSESQHEINQLNGGKQLSRAEVVSLSRTRASASRTNAPIYRELHDSASSIVTELLRMPRLLIDAIAFSSSLSRVGFIALNRLLHPYFCDSSATTALLLDAIVYQSERFRLRNGRSSDPKGPKLISLSLFIDSVNSARAWNPLMQPLPVSPNVQNESLLTTLLKLYAIRVDATSFFRKLWSPVFPSIVSLISGPGHREPTKFNSFVKVALRLLTHTFSEKSVIAFPATVAAVSRAIYALSGTEGLCVYLFDLLVLPNVIKILSLSDYDIAGGDVMNRFLACFSQSKWWPESSEFNHLPMNTFIWMVWRLFTGSIGITGLALSTLSSKIFFSGAPHLDSSSMPDQRLQTILSALCRSIKKSCRLIVHLSLDASGCEYFSSDALVVTAELKTALPDLSKYIERRLHALLPKPREMLCALVMSRYEVATLFDAVSYVINNDNEGDGAEDKIYAVGLLKEEIESYRLIEKAIQKNIPQASQPASEQMMLQLPYGPVPLEASEKDIRISHHQLSRGLLEASCCEGAARLALTRLQQGVSSSLSDLTEGCDPSETLSLETLNDSGTEKFTTLKSPGPPEERPVGVRLIGVFDAPTESSSMKSNAPHRGVGPVVKGMDKAEQMQAEDDEVAAKRAGRLQEYLRESQATSAFTGTRYTLVDSDLEGSHLLRETESSSQRGLPDTRPKTSNTRDQEVLFKSSLWNGSERSGHVTPPHRVSGTGYDLTGNGKAERRGSSTTPTRSSQERTSSRLSNKSLKSSPDGRPTGNATSSVRLYPKRPSRTGSSSKPFPEHLRNSIRQDDWADDDEGESNWEYSNPFRYNARGEPEGRSGKGYDDSASRPASGGAGSTSSKGHRKILRPAPQEDHSDKFAYFNHYQEHNIKPETNPLYQRNRLQAVSSHEKASEGRDQSDRHDEWEREYGGNQEREREQHRIQEMEQSIDQEREAFKDLDTDWYGDIDVVREKEGRRSGDRNRYGDTERPWSGGSREWDGRRDSEKAAYAMTRKHLKQRNDHGRGAEGRYRSHHEEQFQSDEEAPVVRSRRDSPAPSKSKSNRKNRYGSSDSQTGRSRSTSLKDGSVRSNANSPSRTPPRSRAHSGPRVEKPRRVRSATTRADRAKSPGKRRGRSLQSSPERYRAPQPVEAPGWRASSPSMTHPPFKPSGWGRGHDHPIVPLEPSRATTPPNYSFASRELSAGAEGVPFLKVVLRKSSEEEALSQRSESRDRLLQPSRPMGLRQSSSRPLPGSQSSSSSISDISSKHQREVFEGITPGLREYEEVPGVRPVFRPPGSTHGVPIPMQEYDLKIADSLSRSVSESETEARKGVMPEQQQHQKVLTTPTPSGGGPSPVAQILDLPNGILSTVSSRKSSIDEGYCTAADYSDAFETTRRHETVPHNVQQFVPHNVQQFVPHNVQQFVPHNVQQSAPHNVQQSAPQNVQQSVPENVQQFVPQNVQQFVPHNVHQSVPQNVQQSVPQNVQQSVPQNIQQSVPQNVQQSVPQNIQQVIQHDIRQALHRATYPATLLADTDMHSPHSVESLSAYASDRRAEHKQDQEQDADSSEADEDLKSDEQLESSNKIEDMTQMTSYQRMQQSFKEYSYSTPAPKSGLANASSSLEVGEEGRSTSDQQGDTTNSQSSSSTVPKGQGRQSRQDPRISEPTSTTSPVRSNKRSASPAPHVYKEDVPFTSNPSQAHALAHAHRTHGTPSRVSCESDKNISITTSGDWEVININKAVTRPLSTNSYSERSTNTADFVSVSSVPETKAQRRSRQQTPSPTEDPTKYITPKRSPPHSRVDRNVPFTYRTEDPVARSSQDSSQDDRPMGRSTNTPQRNRGSDEVRRIGSTSWSVMDMENESVSDTTALSAVSAGLAMLMAGIPVMKRGKRGRPKKKIIRFVEASQELQWTPAEAEGKGEEEPKQRFRYNCFPKIICSSAYTHGSSICVDSITDVYDRDDRESDGVVEDRVKNMLKNLGPHCCLVVTRERTLDLTFRNAQEMKSITAAIKEMLKETWQIRTTSEDIGDLPYDETFSPT